MMRQLLDLLAGFTEHDFAFVEVDPRFKDVIRYVEFLRGARESMGTPMQESPEEIRDAMDALGVALYEMERDLDVPADAIRLLAIEHIKLRDH